LTRFEASFVLASQYYQAGDMTRTSFAHSTRWTASIRFVVYSVVLAATLLPLGGCGGPRYLTVRKAAHNPLEGPLNLLSKQGPHPTQRTLQTLRKYDLEQTQEKDPQAALERLKTEMVRDPTPDKVQAYAELAYIAGYAADHLGDDARALDMYSAAVASAYDYLFDPIYDPIRNPYDPQFRRVCDLYNAALEANLRIVRANGKLLPGEHLLVDTGTEKLDVSIVAHGSWSPDQYAGFEFVSDYNITGLTNRHHGYGLGVPLIAIRKPGATNDPVEKFYPEVLSFPMTAFLRIVPASPGAEQVHRQCVLELYEPLDAGAVVVDGRKVPLETDLSVPLGYMLQEGRGTTKTEMATLGLLHPGETSDLEGIYMIAPYDPRKIPVVVVHGLWSSPLTWMEMLNDLLAYPEIRENFQFWFYFYPTGEPFWYGATALRQDLDALRRTLDPDDQNPVFHDVVLIGHSMGGLVSMWQTLDSGNAFWNLLSDQPFNQLKADPEIRNEVAQVVFFHPDPCIRRVITIATPHRGSRFANQYTRFLARKLIQLPARMLMVQQQLVSQNPGMFRNTDLLTISTSIDSLSPKSPVLPAMLHAPRPPYIHYHNIVGVLPKETWLGWLTSWTNEKGDGVVSFASAHRADFESELVVPADHMRVHAQPRSILEVRRILLQHLREARSMQSGQVIPASHQSLSDALRCGRK